MTYDPRRDLTWTRPLQTDGEPYELRHFQTVARNVEHVRVVFHDLEDHLRSMLHPGICVVGCVAWLTSPEVLRALSRTDGVAMLVQKETFLRSNAELRALYAALPQVAARRLRRSVLASLRFDREGRLDAVRCIGTSPLSKTASRPLMHHKFLVFCRAEDGKYGDAPLEPYAVWTGSFNFTMNASYSFENAIIIRDAAIATAYFREFAQLFLLSEPLDWTSHEIEPEWPIMPVDSDDAEWN